MTLATLRAPYKLGDRWCLEGAVDLTTGDTLTLRFEVSPRTLAWAQRFGEKGIKLAGRGFDAVKRRVRVSGDWSSFGPLADAAADALACSAEDKCLQPPKKYLTLKEHYEAAKGDKGEQEQERVLQAIGHAAVEAEAGDAEAQEAMGILKAMGTVDALIASPVGYAEVGKLRDMARSGDEAAMSLSHAAKALGSCCCTATNIAVATDAEAVLLDSDHYLDFLRHADDVMLLRALGARRKGSSGEALRAMDAFCHTAFAREGRYDGSFAPYADYRR